MHTKLQWNIHRSIQSSGKTPFQFKIPRNLIELKKNQVKSVNGWDKCQCADSNNMDNIRIHEGKYKSIAVHFPYQFPDKKM